MKSNEYLTKHSRLILDALNDYKKWFEKGEDQTEEVNTALEDFGKITDLFDSEGIEND